MDTAEVGREPPALRERRRSKSTNWIAAATLAASLLVCASIVLTGRFSHDEHMYLSAGALLGGNSLYGDFAYLQAPYMPYVYHWAFEIAGSDRLLTVARLLKVFIVFALVLAAYGACASLSGSPWFALGCVLLTVNNGVFRATIPFATNLDLATSLVLISVWVYACLRRRKRAFFAQALAGIGVGLAIGTKLTFAPVLLCFVLPALAEFGASKRATRMIGAFVAGLAGALAPAFLVCLAAGPDIAYFNNLGYHRLNALWRAETGFDHGMSLPDKLIFMRDQLLPPQNSLLLLAVAVAGVLWCSVWFRATSRPKWDPLFLTVLLLVAASIAMFIVPTPIWRGYLSPFVVFVTLAASAFYAYLARRRRRAVLALVWAAAAFLAARNAPADFRRAVESSKVESWTGSWIHRNALALKSIVPESERARPVATLSPLYALEAGLPVYRELATGEFAYRIGDRLSVEDSRRYRITSRRDLTGLLDRSPPSAIVTGFSGDLEEPLATYARERGYTRVENIVDGGEVFVKNGASSGRNLE